MKKNGGQRDREVGEREGGMEGEGRELDVIHYHSFMYINLFTKVWPYLTGYLFLQLACGGRWAGNIKHPYQKALATVIT